MLVNIFENFLGETRRHNEDTGQISFDCPVCSAESNLVDGDGKGNLEINYHKGVFKCWSCHESNRMHGKLPKLVKRFGSAKDLRDYLIFKPDSDDFIVKEEKEITVTLPEDYQKLSECTFKDFKYHLAMKYLRDRGITDEIIKEYEIGYIGNGLFFNRIIIPSYDAEGELNYYIARWFGDSYNKLKYINPKVPKQEIIFNEYKINWYSTIYLVEGVFDHIVVPNSIPLLGKVISDKLLGMLQNKARAFVVIVLDDDAYDDAVTLYDKLNFGDLRNKIKIVKMPKGYDPSKIYEVAKAKGIASVLMNSHRLKDRYLL